MQLDCRSQDIAWSELSLAAYSLVICDSQVKHAHASSGYNDRKNECDQLVSHFRQLSASFNSLRDLNKEMLLAEKDKLSPLLYKRAQFILEENARVLEGRPVAG